MSKNIATLIFVMLLAILLSNQNLISSLDANSKSVVSNVLEEVTEDFFISDDTYELVGDNYRATIYDTEAVYDIKPLSVDSLMYKDEDGFKNVDIFLEGYEELLGSVTLSSGNLLNIPYPDYYVNIYNPDSIVRDSRMSSADLQLIPGVLYQVYVKENEKYAVKLISAKDDKLSVEYSLYDLELNEVINNYEFYNCVDGRYSFLVEVDGAVGNLTKGIMSDLVGETSLEDDSFQIIGTSILKGLFIKEIIGYDYKMRLTITHNNSIVYNNNTQNYRSIGSIK